MFCIYKFGGASVKDAIAVENLKKIISRYSGNQLLIIVSAMGKSTNHLEAIVDKIVKGDSYEKDLSQFLKYHYDLCNTLFGLIPDEIIKLEYELQKTVNAIIKNHLEFQDSVVAFGELFSTTILAKYLNVQWVDAREYIKTNDQFSEAEVDWVLTERFIQKDFPELLSKGIVITQGFIGSDVDKRTTTLGREGSDYTAAIFANCLNAQSLTVWKDVPGLLNADPKIFPKAEKFDHISYQEVIEMTYYGAKVIHPKTIHPLAKKGIPLFVRSFIEPMEKGTEISEDEKVGNKTCFIFKENQILVSVRVKDTSFMDERKMSFILQSLSHVNIKANLIHNSALTFTFCMDASVMKRDKIVSYLAEEFQVLYNENLWLATIKNHTPEAFLMLPENIEPIIEEKSRNNYQIVYRLK
ncbi:MAG: aspartate kinase [Cyclobacteriaceae bacterium]|jgi:aspartate kinase